MYSEDNMRTLIAENRIWFGKNGTSFLARNVICQKFNKVVHLTLGGRVLKSGITKKVHVN